MADKPVTTIRLIDWDYTCGDGCCYLYGTYVEIDGERLRYPEGPYLNFDVSPDELKGFLAHLLPDREFDIYRDDEE